MKPGLSPRHSMDGELYLRLAAERCLAEAMTPGNGTAARSMRPFWAARTALVAVGAVSEEAGRAIDEDTRVAMALRGLRGAGVDLSFPPVPIARPWATPGPPAAVMPCVVRSCVARIELATGTLQTSLCVWQASSATLTGEVLRVSEPPRPPNRGSVALDARGTQRPGYRRLDVDESGSPVSEDDRPGPVRPRFDDLVLTDDDGNRYRVAAWSGGGSTDRWEVRLTVEPTPPPTLTALSFARDLGGPIRAGLDPPPPVRIRSLPVGGLAPGVRYLRDQLERAVVHTTGGTAPPRAADPDALAALLAVGALDHGEPLLGVVEALDERMADGPRPAIASAIAAHLGPAPTAAGPSTVVDPTSLPRAWAGIIDALDRDDGHEVALPLGVLLSIGGRSPAVVESLVSGRRDFTVQWTTPQDQAEDLEPQRGLRLQAEDDLGGAYVSRLDSGSGSGGILHLSQRFRPRLDPAASTLKLVGSGRRDAVELTIPLPAPWGQE